MKVKMNTCLKSKSKLHNSNKKNGEKAHSFTHFTNTDYILSQNQHKQPKIKISRETIFRANYGQRRKQWRV